MGSRFRSGHSLRGLNIDKVSDRRKIAEAFIDVLEHSKRHGDGRVFVKLGRAASGMGVREVRSVKGFLSLLRKDPRFPDQMKSRRFGLRIDAAVDAKQFPNVMIWVGDSPKKDRYIYSSRQLLAKLRPTDKEGSVHVGNVAPLEKEVEDLILPHTETVVHWLRKIGFRGLAGLDFAVNPKTGKVWFLEVNGRVNGNNGAGFMVMGLRQQPKVWAYTGAVKVPNGTTLEEYVAFLEKKDINYSMKTGIGVFVANVTTARKGSLQVGICADSREEAERFIRGAQAFLA